MDTRKLMYTAKMTDGSKSVLYRNKAIMLQDIWQFNEIAKIRVAALVLKAKSISELQGQDCRHLDVVAQELLEKPVEQFEQKIADKNAEFQIMYNTEDGDILFCGNTIHPFVIPHPPKRL